MTVLRAQVTIPRDNSIPSDSIMNTWHFLTVGAATPAAAAIDVMDQLEAFYGVVDSLMAAYIGSPAVVKIYNLADAEPRVPIQESPITLTTATGLALPGEVSLCLSYRGELLSGTNPRRRRGRIYLGPFDSDITTTDSGDCRPTTGTLNSIATAAQVMIESGVSADARWVVFSPTLAGGGAWSESIVEDASCDVQNGYVDNAFDTIRSRGADPTSRVLFSDFES